MPACKACGEWFAKTRDDRVLCSKCEMALGRLAGYAVVVTRCKDCKHFNHKRMECENEAISTDHEGGAQYSLNFWPDDFCSYGEPKEGDHADDHD